MTHQPHKEQGGRALRAPVGDGLSSLRDRAPAGLDHSASIPREEPRRHYQPLTAFQMLERYGTVRARGMARKPFDGLVQHQLADWMPVEGQRHCADYWLTSTGKEIAARHAPRLAA